ncbi:MAG: phosphogluconate dehydratase [Alphaproteobacteria bacterium]|nr:phosphogluconate dehydratase [Alphaproteobacteria bacterium]
MPLNATLIEVTARIAQRSTRTRADYLERMGRQHRAGINRAILSCGNLAHGFAACTPGDKAALAGDTALNIGIITAYNDMLSAHQPFEDYPEQIRAAAREMGATALVAGGVPAMCDGVTQGQPGMDLSLFSRDLIAMSAAVGLSHNMFDAALFLGVCDKIVPGLLIAALSFGHLPAVFVPAGPMPTGLPNDEKARVRQLFAEGRVDRKTLLEAEAKSYHSPGTCTFYGTANSNQMLMEIMGLHLPGASFVNPGTQLRAQLTKAAVQVALSITDAGDTYIPVCRVIGVKTIVNGIVGLLATGGSTNHAIHLVAMAAAAGVCITWADMSDLSAAVPLLARVYPNGSADVNHFHAAGGVPVLIRELLGAGLLHGDVTTILGEGLERYCVEPALRNGGLEFVPAPEKSADPKVLGSAEKPFGATGGLKLLAGNLGQAIIKTSAVKPEHRFIEAPARVFKSQSQLQGAFKTGALTSDMVAVLRFAGPRAIGMPELHRLTPPLGVLLDRGLKVALLTDGRMSGASGKVPAAIHLTPEAICDGPIARIRDGDMIRLDVENGTLDVLVDEAEFAARSPARADLGDQHEGMGREPRMRASVGPADKGASIF